MSILDELIPGCGMSWTSVEENISSTMSSMEVEPCVLRERGAVLARFGAAIADAYVSEVLLSGVTKTQSPIEELMLYGLLAVSVASFGIVIIGDPDGEHSDVAFPGDRPGRVLIQPQARIAEVTPDFRVAMNRRRGDGGAAVYVECDGHDYHERTKAQARSDRSRDRNIARLGYTVLRFTGSEINASPLKCGMSVIGHLWDALSRSTKGAG